MSRQGRMRGAKRSKQGNEKLAREGGINEGTK